MTVLLIAVVILLAAILITLLGAWGKVHAAVAIIIGLCLWGGLAAVAGTHLGAWAGWCSLALPFVLLFAVVVIDEVRNRAKRLPSVVKQTAPVDHDQQSNEEEERRAELAALRKDIQDRSR